MFHEPSACAVAQLYHLINNHMTESEVHGQKNEEARQKSGQAQPGYMQNLGFGKS
jgi:hypothetical protein